jgi:Raf kinase inhibitor-like YbhB/YbcL family protein
MQTRQRPTGRRLRSVAAESHRLAIEQFESVPGVRMSSSAFPTLGPIPKRYTRDGENISPPLFWDGPASAVSFVLLCEDPDAWTPRPFVHWVVYGLHVGTNALLGGVEEGTPGFVQGVNSYGHPRYDGPSPPAGDGPHEYHFQLFALDRAPEFEGVADRDDLIDAIRGHVVGVGEIVGTYER